MRFPQGLALVIGALAGVTACASEVDRAFEYAAQDARDAAERGRLQVESAARRAEDERTALADAVATDPKRVFGERTTPDGFEVDAVFYGLGQAGGGGTAEVRAVRLCVRFVGRLRPEPVVEAHDVECAESVPTDTPEVGTVHRTIRLR